MAAIVDWNGAMPSDPAQCALMALATLRAGDVMSTDLVTVAEHESLAVIDP